MTDAPEDLLRRLAPQVLSALVRRYGHFDTAEDAVQEALLAAALQWPAEGVPNEPRDWLITVASRRLIDLLRRDEARQRREGTLAQQVIPDEWQAPAADQPASEADDTLILLVHVLSPDPVPGLPDRPHPARGRRAQHRGGRPGLSGPRGDDDPADHPGQTADQATAVSRSGCPRATTGPADSGVVLHVLYLIFNEGYAATAGPALQRGELAQEAIRLVRMVRALLPDDSEVAGLLALMLLTDARRPARTAADGSLVPMSEQDRTLWDAALIREGVELVTEALPRGAIGPYQLQAAIAALHDEAPSIEATDWPQIKALYGLLLRISDNPIVALNHAVAVGMADGPQAGLELLTTIEGDSRIAKDHRLPAVRAQFWELAGDHQRAREAYEVAARLTASVPQQRYLRTRAARSGHRGR